jgi:hypothetical protein
LEGRKTGKEEDMINLLQSFAGGLCFAFGAFVGIALAGMWTRKRDYNMANRFAEINGEVRDRLTKQVEALSRIAATLEDRKRGTE